MKLFEFGAPSCPYCTVQKKKQVLEKVAGLHPKLECLRVDVEEQEALADKYEVKGIPCYVLVDEEGDELERVEGAAPVKALDKMLKKATAEA